MAVDSPREAILHGTLDLDLMQRLGIALAIGLLIGIERGWQEREVAEGERALGLRTHAIAELLGGIWGAIVRGQGDGGFVALGLALAAFSLAAAIFRLREVRHQGSYGATTIVAAMIAFSLGAFAVLGDSVVASAAGVATVSILALKPALHGWVKRLTWTELRAGLLWLAMTVVLLPVLPDRDLGPLQAFNPHELWLMTVLIATVSFVGYIAVKIEGERRGLLLSGLAGGLVSSTAVTLSMARLAKDNGDKVALFISGALLASVAMLLRVLVISVIFNSQMAIKLAPPLVLAALSQGAVIWFLQARGHIGSVGADCHAGLKNPFDLSFALSFGALLAVIGLLAKVAALWAGAKGVLALAAVSGLADVDAITLSMAKLARGEIGHSAASLAVLLAVAVNTGTKAGLAWVTGGRRIGLGIAIASAIALVSGLLGLAVSINAT